MEIETLPPLHFNYHNLVKEKIATNNTAAWRFFAEECKSHRIEGNPPQEDGVPEVTLNFYPLTSRVPGGFVRASHKVLARLAYQIAVEPGRVSIQAYGNPLSISLIHHMLVHHSLRYLVSFRDTLMLHAGAVVYRGRSLILTGHGGVGKTTLTSLMLARGGPDWSVHADDYVFLTGGPAGAESLAYLTRAHIYRSLLSPVPQIKEVLTGAERLRLEAFWRLRTLAGIKLPVRIPLSRLWPEHQPAMKAIPAALVVLQRGEVDRPVLRNLRAEEAPIDSLLEMNFGEARNFLNLSNRSLPAPIWIRMVEQWRQNEKTFLEKFFQHTPVYSLTIPQLAVAIDNTALFNSLAGLVGWPGQDNAGKPASP